MPEGKGLLIVYTGREKARRLARWAWGVSRGGAGLRVLMVQFIKGSWHYGELDAAKMHGRRQI